MTKLSHSSIYIRRQIDPDSRIGINIRSDGKMTYRRRMKFSRKVDPPHQYPYKHSQATVLVQP
jgi:hypothetical protein